MDKKTTKPIQIKFIFKLDISKLVTTKLNFKFFFEKVFIIKKKQFKIEMIKKFNFQLIYF